MAQDFSQLADQTSIDKTMTALKENGIDSFLASSTDEAKQKAFELIPEGSEVMTMTSKTLEALALPQVFNESGKYNSVRNKLNDEKVDAREKKRIGAAPEYAIGSVHAVTEDGHVFIASNTGSQLAAYVSGADHVVWMVGTQKIVKGDEEAKVRLYEYTLPLESKRAHEAYGVPASFISKLLIVNKEVKPGRVTIVFIKENLGF